jgi:hypothetical protein
MTEGPERLERAAELVRNQPPDTQDWETTSRAIMRSVRASVRPGRQLLLPLTDDRGSATYVNERVLRRALQGAFSRRADCALSDAVLDIDDSHLTRVAVEVVGRYDTDLLRLAEECRALVRATLHETLGAPAADGPDPALGRPTVDPALGRELEGVTVDVEMVDVELDDPNR